MRCFAVLIGLALVFGACSENAQLDSERHAMQATRVWTRLYTDQTRKLVKHLARDGYDVTGSHQRLGFVDVLTGPEQRDKIFAKYGKIIGASRALDIDEAGRALSDYHDPAEVEAFLDQVQANYPSIAKKVLLQDNLYEGHTIWAMKISDNVDSDEDEPTFLMDGQIHAREVMTQEVMLDAIDYLTSNYGSDPQVTRWVNEIEIWIVPVVNPDGAAYVFEHDNMWRKNRDPACGADIGVDCNRNFEWNFAACPGASTDCWDETYQGSGPASELETQAISQLQQELRPQYYINYHSYGEYIIWPTACGRTQEQDLLASIGQALNERVETDSGQTGQWTIGTAPDVLYSAPGGADDNAYGTAGTVGLTFELNSNGFQPDFASWRDITCQRQRAAWGHLLDRTLDYPSIGGHTYDADTLAPLMAQYQYVNHPFEMGQWPLHADSAGRFGRPVLANSDHLLVFTAPGYLPESRQVHVDSGPVDLDVPMHPGVNHAPTADAGPDQTVDEGDAVTLDASASSDPDGNTLLFSWTQTGGPQVDLQNASGANPTFTAPFVMAQTDLVFAVVASDGELDSAPDSVTVTVRDVYPSFSISSSDTPMDIPDNDSTGIDSVIQVDTDCTILHTSVTVNITHTYIGDLLVTLESPSATVVTLHDHQGGSQHDLNQTYYPAEFDGQSATGAWTLHVADTASYDTGTLDGWSLMIDCQATNPCDTPADCNLPNVDQHGCVGGQCTVVSCDNGFGDCNGQVTDGCEVNLQNDAANCGACGNACQLDHASSSCQSGSCVIASCLGTWLDCNNIAGDGCEVDTASDPLNCGACGSACQLDHAVAGCSGSTCVVSSCTGTWGDCNQLPADGCEYDLSSDMQNCGACGAVCQLDHASSQCQGGLCLIVSCDSGWSDCNGSDADGCESDTASDPLNCGSCGAACQYAHASAACSAGQCSLQACDGGFDDCNGDDADGCEVELASDAAHCGSCQNACSVAHGTPGCSAGSCVVAACDPGFGDCNSQVSDGCETGLNDDPQNCGSCGHGCSFANAEAGCQAGQCRLGACHDGFGDCNGSAADGCETATGSDLQNCGSCGHACSFPNATASCVAGQCLLDQCREGFADCNGSAADGCEAELASDEANCGACGALCQPAHAQGGCSQGSCVIASCQEGFADCNRDGSDGCEVDVAGDPANCGGCNSVCHLAHAQAGCQAGNCLVLSCEEGFADCNGDAADGCEVFLLADDENCGSCGTSCRGAHVATGDCHQGVCRVLACQEGFGDCNASAADGCEAELAADPKNCGACGNVCKYDHASPACNGGQCSLGACREGFADCNADSADGCETPVSDDPENCGACGNVCDSGQSCQDGNCRQTCADKDGDGHPSAACGGDDCDDSNPDIHPGAQETCNVKDDDCNGRADDGIDCPGGGCSCSAAAGGTGAWPLGLLLLVFLRRRKRR